MCAEFKKDLKDMHWNLRAAKCHPPYTESHRVTGHLTQMNKPRRNLSPTNR